ncbi:XrtA/PEP-CTERM system histidine kinase PrsK [Colwellia sp. MEBiC06753]
MNLVGITGYALAAATYFVFLLLLLVIRKKSLIATLIIVSASLTVFSSLLSTWQIFESHSLKLVLVVENIKLLSFVLLLTVAHSGFTLFSQIIRSKSFYQYAVATIGFSAGCWWLSFYAAQGSHYIFLLFLSLNLAIIILLEQLYRNSNVQVKWALWPLVIALGMVSVVDFIIFAQATMLDQLDFDFWFARGYVIAVSMPFFLISARRLKDWSVDVFVSRDVVFYSSMLLISGGYLLMLAFAGYALKLLGGQWGNVLSITFAVLGITVLAALLLTEKLRREVKVFITKHFFANKYDYRIEWLKSIDQIASSKGQDSYRTAIDIMCSTMNIQRGALLKKMADGQFKLLIEKHVEIAELDQTSLASINDFCQKNAWIIDVREYIYVESSYPELSLNLSFFEQNKIDTVIPIFSSEQQLYGLFLLSRGNDKSLLNWEDRDLLFAITKQLTNYLSLSEANNKLAESKQFEAFHRMSAFLVHDLKNVQAQLALINNNATKHRDNPAFIDDVFETVLSATERLEKVLTQLRNKNQAEHIPQKRIKIAQAIDKVVNQRNINKPSVKAKIDGELTAYVNDELISVLNHLVQNAQEASNENDVVELEVTQTDSRILIIIRDNGCGMSESFIKNRLFKPFDSTKGNAGMGIGAFEAKQFVETHQGTIDVVSAEHEGTTFTLSIPYQQ